MLDALRFVMQPNIFIFLFSILFILIFPESIYSKMSETEIKKDSELFLKQLLQDNTDEEDAIKRLSTAIIKDKRAGIRFMDKCALFIRELKAKNIQIVKSRLYSRKNSILVILFLNDLIENNTYILYLEYEYAGSDNHLILLGIHISFLFDEKLNEMKQFFETR